MRQLQLFTSSELAKMRDRTKRRNYSEAGEEFRREHERHRAWGLAQRHAARLRYLRNLDRDRPSDRPTASGAPASPREASPELPADQQRRAEAADPIVNRDADPASREVSA
ncbi:hypothetical protein JIG36_00075 [Actinoplanes sp. LDG1-06]|uniref:Uncharacterized protein n=1 Tax=Paractinoplanes ovalisporus TaxID=2810368 RepID=A0ABS2A264_9ACTN|nr:hypothetical protein [Actinoplanes ovalisporus]MBM2613950.1 hypothetical protein [Actinoplanes ovalisporus]